MCGSYQPCQLHKKAAQVKALNDAGDRRFGKGFGEAAARLGRQPVNTMGSLRRQTLVAVRWGAIVGQTLALLIVSQVLGYNYPLMACGLVIIASAVVNVAVTLAWPLDRRVSNFEAYMQLGFDLWQLAALLWLTGGINNPFAILFLAPVVTSAVTLSRWVVWALGAMAMGLSLALVFFHQPLPWMPAGSFDLPATYKLGIWTAIVVGSAFTTFYAWRTTQESRKMSVALATAEAMLAGEQKLSALGGLAAAAAHELGTPLATIQVVAREMSRELEAGTPLAEDAHLLLSQAQRCRDILEQLAVRGDRGDMIHDVLSPEDLLEEAAEPYIGRGRDITITAGGDGLAPQLTRRPELLYALKNYIDNAVDFAAERVELSARWSAGTLTIDVEDDGPGFDAGLMDRLGQPYASTRSRERALKARLQKSPDKPHEAPDLAKTGLGLGVFISATLIERTGGRVTYGRSGLGGARVRAIWPLALLSESVPTDVLDAQPPIAAE